MPRDYKHRAHRNRKRGVSPWLTLTGGLLVGLFVAFLVYIRMQAKPVTQVYVKETLPMPARQQAPAGKASETGKDGDKTAGKTTPAPQAPKPRFDFYTRLPEMEVEVPEQAITGKTEQGVKQVEQPGTYYIQVGSFRSHDQADRFKAQLALMGLETSIQKVTIDNNNTWHRVRVGPFSDLNALNRARRLLSQHKIDSTLVRMKP